MAFPTKAKMTALVWSGRVRPKVVNSRLKFMDGMKICKAINRPARRPTTPQTIVAMAKFRVNRLSYENFCNSILMCLILFFCCYGLHVPGYGLSLPTVTEHCNYFLFSLFLPTVTDHCDFL